MIRWPFRKKDASQDEAAAYGSDAPIDDEWAFLRTQPDHDADEMASVHGTETAQAVELPAPAPARTPAPAWTPAGKAERPQQAAAQDPDGPTLALEVTTSGGSRRIQVSGEALVGRTDAARGAAPQVDLTGDSGVSRQHALITCTDGQFSIRDLDSIGGTRLNGEWLSSDVDTPLSPGDCLELGLSSRILILADIAEAVEEADLTEEDVLLGGMLREAMGIAPAPDPDPAPARPAADRPQEWRPGAPSAYAAAGGSPQEPAPAPWQPRSRTQLQER